MVQTLTWDRRESKTTRVPVTSYFRHVSHVFITKSCHILLKYDEKNNIFVSIQVEIPVHDKILMQKRFFLPLCVCVCVCVSNFNKRTNKRTKNWHNTNRNNIKRTSSDIMTRRKKYIFLLKGNLCRRHTAHRYMGQQRWGKKTEKQKNQKHK